MKNAKVQLFGNIGKLEAQYTPQGKYVLKGSLAVNHGKRGADQVTNWYNFTAWEQTGEWMNKSCEVGTQVYIDGSLLLREWNDRDGLKHLSPDVTVSDWRVISRGKKKDSDSEIPEAEGNEFPF